jgi:multidrug efflux pump subunit AcrB
MLMGIVCKNSILLVDEALQQQAGGQVRREAMLNSGTTRARPIIMTTLAMVAGMVPVVLGWSPDASFRAPMAVTVMGGLLASTVLSLVFVPVVFTAFDDLRMWAGRQAGSLLNPAESDPVDSP